jgi:hypothetical protein
MSVTIKEIDLSERVVGSSTVAAILPPMSNDWGEREPTRVKRIAKLYTLAEYAENFTLEEIPRKFKHRTRRKAKWFFGKRIHLVGSAKQMRCVFGKPSPSSFGATADALCQAPGNTVMVVRVPAEENGNAD